MLETIIGNLHPAFVHLPIGALITYSLMEIFSLLVPNYKEKLETGKYFVLLFGLIGGGLSYQTGEALEHTLSHSNLIETHSLFASITLALYGGAAALLTSKIANKNKYFKNLIKNDKRLIRLWEFTYGYIKIFNNKWVLNTLAILGILAIFITGALGGAIAYGPEKDFITNFIYSLFF